MATIKKQGRGYQITVSTGYDFQGKRLRKYMTWIPDPDMTEKQAEKEVQRQAALFEEKILKGTVIDSNIRFKDFADRYMTEYGELHLSPKSIYTYTENLKRINQAIGHIKMSKLRVSHINAFYRNLQEEGVRQRITATPRIDLQEAVGTKRGDLSAFTRKAGIARSTIQKAIAGKPVSKESAEAIASALGVKLEKAFTITVHNEPLSPASVISYHRTLSSILSKAVQWEVIQDNPAAKAEKPKLGNHEAAYLEEEDARRLLELLQEEPIQWRALITFDLLSGLRRGELLGLRWDDVDLDAHTIQVKQTSNYLPKKGVYTKTTKTEKSTRPLHLSTAAVMMLLEYKRWQDEQALKLGDAWKNEDGRVFTTELGAPIFPDSPTLWFSKFIKRSGLPEDITVHSLRHTYATLMIADHVPLVVVSKQLGHAQTSTTANIYAHAIASAQAKAMETFDRFNDLLAPKEEEKETKKAAGD